MFNRTNNTFPSSKYFQPYEPLEFFFSFLFFLFFLATLVSLISISYPLARFFIKVATWQLVRRLSEITPSNLTFSRTITTLLWSNFTLFHIHARATQATMEEPQLQ